MKKDNQTDFSMQGDQVYDYLKSLRGRAFTLRDCRRLNQDSQYWILEKHKHDFIELIYFVSGEAEVVKTTGNERLVVYDVLVHPKGIHHHESVNLHLRQEVINLMVDCDPDVEHGIQDSFILRDDTGFIKNIFEAIEYHYSKKDTFSSELIEYYLQLLMRYLLKSKIDNFNSRNNILNRAIDFIHDNYSKRITVSDVADAAHVSESYLSRIMRRELGFSPIEYVNIVKMEMAKKWLKTELSVEEVSVAVGFSGSKYFSTVFKRYTGLTPTEFRDKIS